MVSSDEDRAKKRTYNRAYNASHREQIIASRKAHDIAHPEELEKRRTYMAIYQKAWTRSHPDATKAINKAFYASNREALCASSRRRYAANIEKVRANKKVYDVVHRSEGAARASTRRARESAATVGDTVAIKAIYRRAREDKNVKCYLCGKRIPLGERHVDHVIPLSKGGKHTGSNLAIAHKKCNLKKHAKMPEDVGLLL
jgi:5-methylcytosine-specific restriction endonuclease McrA